MHEGHRKRMLERLEKDERAFQDHELLEILLFNAIPRKNTNELAHALLSAFGSIDGVLRASERELTLIKGIGPEVAAYLRVVGLFCQQVKFCERALPKNVNLETFLKFLPERFAGQTEEVAEIYCVDSRENVTYCQRHTSFEEKKTNVDLNAVNRLFTANKPHGILLAHNHPTVISCPSRADDEFTARLIANCSMHGIRFYDHLIMGIDGVYSYFHAGRLDKLREAFNIENILKEKLDDDS